MGRLPYEKQYELAYQIYEALCAQHPDWLVALSDTKAYLRSALQGRQQLRLRTATARVLQQGTFRPATSINSGSKRCCAGHSMPGRR